MLFDFLTNITKLSFTTFIGRWQKIPVPVFLHHFAAGCRRITKFEVEFHACYFTRIVAYPELFLGVYDSHWGQKDPNIIPY